MIWVSQMSVQVCLVPNCSTASIFRVGGSKNQQPCSLKQLSELDIIQRCSPPSSPCPRKMKEFLSHFSFQEGRKQLCSKTGDVCWLPNTVHLHGPAFTFPLTASRGSLNANRCPTGADVGLAPRGASMGHFAGNQIPERAGQGNLPLRLFSHPGLGSAARFLTRFLLLTLVFAV